MAQWQGRERFSQAPHISLVWGFELRVWGKDLDFPSAPITTASTSSTPGPAVRAHNLLVCSPRLGTATGSQKPSSHQQLANADKFLPLPSAGFSSGLSSWEPGVRVRPLSFAMQTQKINLPASSDIWAELQAGSGDKARAKGSHRYSGEPGCLAQALVRADNSSPPSVMHNSPALPPSVRSSLSLLSLISYKNWKPACPREPEGHQATHVGAEAHLDRGNKHACAPRNTAAPRSEVSALSQETPATNPTKPKHFCKGLKGDFTCPSHFSFGNQAISLNPSDVIIE